MKCQWEQEQRDGDGDLVILIYIYILFSCLKMSKRFIQTCRRRSERFMQISVRTTLLSARKTWKSFSPVQTLSSTVPPLYALMTLWGTFLFPFHCLYVYVYVHTRVCKFPYGFSGQNTKEQNFSKISPPRKTI